MQVICLLGGDMKSLIAKFAVAAASIWLANSAAHAQSRLVFVNGLRMTDQQVVQLEYFACTRIPNGAYWLNVYNGAWGFMGNWNVQGYFGDQCNLPANAQARQRRESLSE